MQRGGAPRGPEGLGLSTFLPMAWVLPPPCTALLAGRWSTPESVALSVGARAGLLLPFLCHWAALQTPLLALLDGVCFFLRHTWGGAQADRGGERRGSRVQRCSSKEAK